MLDILLQTIILLFVLDFWLYTIHRAMHKYRWMWSFHKVHHSAYAPNFHLFEFTLLWLVPMTVAWWAGYTKTIYVIAFLFVYEVTLTHRPVYKTTSKVHKYLFKFVKGFVGNAKYHKVHHDTPNYNYSQLFILWDVIMGTRRSNHGLPGKN